MLHFLLSYIVAHLNRLQAKVDEVKRLQIETEREMEALVPAVLAKAETIVTWVEQQIRM